MPTSHHGVRDAPEPAPKPAAGDAADAYPATAGAVQATRRDRPASDRTTVHLLVVLGIVAVHLLSGLQMEQPLILADELGYLGNARYLSGTAPMPDLRGCQYYHFGYSLLVAPAFWIAADPVTVYRNVIIVNSLLAGALFLPLWSILVGCLHCRPGFARWIAAACCLYPPLVLYSSLAWSETAYVFFYALAAALFGRFIASRSTTDGVVFGVATGFLYTIHPRGLPVVAMAALLLCIVLAWRVLPVIRALLSLGSMAAVTLATRSVNHHLAALGWSGGGEVPAAKLAERLVPGSDLPVLLERAAGQLLYLIQSTHGAFALGLMAVAWWIRRRLADGGLRGVLSRPATAVPLFVVCSSSAVFVASCTAKLYSLHGPHGVRGADIIHGRYNEAFAVLVMAFALCWLGGGNLRPRRLALRGIAVVAIMLSLSAVVMAEVVDAQRRHAPQVDPDLVPRIVEAADVDPVNVAGVFPIVHAVGRLDLFTVTLVASSVLVLTCCALLVSRRAALGLLAAVFCGFALTNHLVYLLPKAERARPRLDFASFATRLGPPAEASYDREGEDIEFYCGIQYLLQDTVFNRFDSGAGELPASQAVVSGLAWPQAEALDARFVATAGVGETTLWVLPGRLQDRLPIASPEGVSLGAKRVNFVRESGFYRPEYFGDFAGRWTNGSATLSVPLDSRRPPEMLGIATAVPGRDDAELRVVANGVELGRQRIPPDRSWWVLELDSVILDDELLIELLSNTFRPADSGSGSPDQRDLGIVVTDLRIESRASLADAALAGLLLGGEPRFGFPERGFHAVERFRGRPARWTDGRASLTVPLVAGHRPHALEIDVVAPTRRSARLRVNANGIELWQGSVPPSGWSATLALDRVPLTDELRIVLESDTFTPAVRSGSSDDARRLGVMVRAIRLQSQSPS